MMCNLNDEHDNLRSIFCNPTPVIAVATNVESLYSLDCSDVQPDVGLYEGNGILCKGMIEISFVFFFFLFLFFGNSKRFLMHLLLSSGLCFVDDDL